MKINIQICTLLLLFNLITSCNGQVKTGLQKEVVSDPKTNVGGQPKIIRTQGIVSGNLHCNLQDKAGNIWFSTSGEGVYRYDGKSFTNFTKNEGLPSNYIQSIIEDKAGNLWFGTSEGISRYDGKSFISFPAKGGGGC